MKRTIGAFAISCILYVHSPAQTNVGTSITDTSDTREFSLGSIRIEGEVENPEVVQFSSLPSRGVAVKELALDEAGKRHFKGAFLFSGYSLYDILKTAKVKKANEKEFGPPIDLYVVIQNDVGQKALVSWGEVFYAKNRFQILISRSVEAINPTKLKTRWALPSNPQLICGDDLDDVRFIPNPNKIIMRSFSGSIRSSKSEDIYSPEITVVNGSDSVRVSQFGPAVRQRSYKSVGYGHGRGFKGVHEMGGFVLKDVLSDEVKPNLQDLRASILVVSAKDGYRTVFSVSEIFNRNDNQDCVLVDEKDSRTDGRYLLFVPSDFFADRNVKAVERIEMENPDSLRQDNPQ